MSSNYVQPLLTFSSIDIKYLPTYLQTVAVISNFRIALQFSYSKLKKLEKTIYVIRKPFMLFRIHPSLNMSN